VHLWRDHAKTASIVFSKSKSESTGPGDLALEKQKRVSWQQEQKSKNGNLPPKNATVEPFQLCPSKPFLSFLFFPF
jgi:hypothetical protein